MKCNDCSRPLTAEEFKYLGDRCDSCERKMWDRFNREDNRIASDQPPPRHWPDPTPEMLNGDQLFDAIWRTIKSWDINVPEAYGGYCGATGNHVRAIYDAVKNVR